MSCQNDCKLDTKYFCLQCDKLYCSTHGEEHSNELDHAVQIANKKIIHRINQNANEKALNIEKSKTIHKITSNTSLAILNLEEISRNLLLQFIYYINKDS